MVQDFEAIMVEEQYAGDSDTKYEEDFEIEVIFGFAAFGKQDSSRQDAVVKEEDYEVFRDDDVFDMIY